MKVVLAVVASVNGKTTSGRDQDAAAWASSEDLELFSGLIKKHSLIVMGRRTFEDALPRINLKAPKLRIVLTREPERYSKETIPGKIEFSSESPSQLVDRMGKAGYKEMLLVSGEEISRLFFKTNLVNEIHLTLEPLLFGRGKDLLAPLDLNLKLRLLSIKQLNNQGTLHLIYQIKK